jgi:sugar diacid utilization regulator
MVNTLSYLAGIYSVDELPLLYILAYAPFEYKSHLFFHNEEGLNFNFKEGKKEFLDTLRLYVALRNMGDISGLLGIHVNSVKYRVEKALKFLGYEEENILAEVSSVKLLLQLELIVLDN